MKKIVIALLLLLCLLLTACGQEAGLTGTWVNRGRYEQGKDFVETMTLQEDGSAVIHLEYQGRDYQTIRGEWSADEGTLTVTFPDGSARDRAYEYALEGDALTLTGGGKVVEYEREQAD